MIRLSDHFRTLVLALSFIALGANQAHSQTIYAGDLFFTSFDATGAPGADAFSFITLAHLQPNTLIGFTDRSFNSQTSSFSAASGQEGTITWMPNRIVLAGTEIKITGRVATEVATGTPIGIVTVTEGSSTSGYNLSTSGDQLFAFTGTLSPNSVIAGLHFNVCSGTNTSDASWDATSCNTGSSFSQKPTFLTPGFDCMWTGSTPDAFNAPVAPVMGRFNCSGTPVSMLDAVSIRRAITNKANWTLSATNSLTTPSGCTFIVHFPPVITASPMPDTACAGAAATFRVTATDAYSYQWQVSTTGVNGTYTNISNGPNYANATTATLTVNNLPAGFNGYFYRANAINPAGSVGSQGAQLTVRTGTPTMVAQLSDLTACPGGTAILSGLAAGSSIVYKWQMDAGSGFANINDGSNYSNTATPTLTISGITRSMHGHKYRLSANECMSSYSNTATLRLQNVWIGNTSANWNTATNWSCAAVPDSTMDVVINPGANNPVITAGSTVRNITINTGASLTLAAAATLTIKGDLVNLGTFNTGATGATVIFSSPNTQTILPFGNMGFNGSGNKVLKANMTANGNITFNNGSNILLGNHTFTLGPSATINNAGNTQYFVTNGSGGLRKNNLGSASVLFPIGTTTAYNPVTLSNNGTPDNFTARVADSVYAAYRNDIPQGQPLAARAVSKTWYINEDIAGGSDVNMTLQWNTADELNGFNRSSCFISHFKDSTWNPTPATASSGSNPFSQVRQNITSFSPFAVGNIATPLPLQIITFQGARAGNYTVLDWETANEKNIAGFEAERSENGSVFYIIGYVPAQHNTAAARYSFTDKAAMTTSRVYYRLKIKEQDGTYSYSNTIVINQYSGKEPTWQVSPNPVAGNDILIRYAGTGNQVEMTLIDMTGKVWHRLNTAPITGNGTMRLSTGSVPAGNYVLKLKDDTSVQHIKVVRL